MKLPKAPNKPNAQIIYKICCLNVFKSKQLYTYDTRTLRYSRYLMVPKSPQKSSPKDFRKLMIKVLCTVIKIAFISFINLLIKLETKDKKQNRDLDSYEQS